MAKELPYFKFEPAEYLTKDISFCSLSAQGLFINICSYYWQRNCKLTKEQLLKRLNYESELNELISEGVIDLKDSNIIIKFLDIQLVDVAKTSKQNSENGSKGGRPKKPKINPIESENKPTALIPLSETKGIREDKIKEDKIKEITIEEKENLIEDIFKKVSINYQIYAKQLLSDAGYIEALSMNQIKDQNKDVCKNTTHKYLKLFLSHLNEYKHVHNNKKEFSANFSNWLRKQTIVKVYPKQEEIRYF